MQTSGGLFGEYSVVVSSGVYMSRECLGDFPLDLAVGVVEKSGRNACDREDVWEPGSFRLSPHSIPS